MIVLLLLLLSSGPAPLPGGSAFADECSKIVPNSLRVQPRPSQEGVWEVISGSTVIQAVFGQAQASDILKLAKEHTERCRIGRPGTSRFIEYWKGRSERGPLILQTASCRPYSRQRIRIEYVNSPSSSGWYLLDGKVLLMVLDDKADASAALRVAQGHDEYCIIGRGAPVATDQKIFYITQFWK